jgi:magnesium-transporting ATPase (P-type)
MGMEEAQVRQQYKRIGVIPFESDYKFMCTFHEVTGSSKVLVYVKGAPDRLIARSKFEMAADSSLKPIEEDKWSQNSAELSSRGLRCLAVCKYEINRSDLDKAVAQGAGFITTAQPEPFLIFLGIAAIMDPPREECVTAIREAHAAGITVKMITGDHPMTAKAIGEALGIVDPEHGIVKTGPDLDSLGSTELREVVMHCNVYARASPDNKISIIRALQAEKQVCSMTGDGVNDAPALRAADIGVAMGITGTDVSKDSAKMILTDDNFATILIAVKEGRRVWDNLRKLLIFNSK